MKPYRPITWRKLVKRTLRLFATSGLSVALLTGGCREAGLNGANCEALVMPVLQEPRDRETVDTLRPVLSWAYPDSSCEPRDYLVTLYPQEDFRNDLGGFNGDSLTSWTLAADLQPGTEYVWGVRPF